MRCPAPSTSRRLAVGISSLRRRPVSGAIHVSSRPHTIRTGMSISPRRARNSCEVALVGLLDLAIERGLAVGGDPRRHELVEILGAEPAVAGGLDVGGDDGLVDVRGQLRQQPRVLLDEPEERRPGGRYRDDVDEHQRPVAGAVEQVCPQGHGAAEVVGDHVRPVEAPFGDEVGEQLALDAEVDGVLGGLRRRAVAGHVPHVDGVVGAERVREGRQMADENGVPWHSTTAGPEPVRCHATSRSRQTKVATPRSYAPPIETSARARTGQRSARARARVETRRAGK